MIPDDRMMAATTPKTVPKTATTTTTTMTTRRQSTGLDPLCVARGGVWPAAVALQLTDANNNNNNNHTGGGGGGVQ